MGRAGPAVGSFYTITCKVCGEQALAHSYKASTCLSCLAIGLKYCPRCKQARPLEQFKLDNTRRDGYRSYCRACHSRSSVESVRKRSEEDLEYKARRQQASREYCAERYHSDEDWREERKIQSSIHNKERYAEMRANMSEEELTQFREYGAALSRKLYAESAHRREYIINANHTRRATDDTKLTVQEWEQIVQYFNNCCAYCGVPLERPVREHVIPIAKGGITCVNNIVCACAACNGSKGTRDWREWFRAQSFWTPERERLVDAWINQE